MSLLGINGYNKVVPKWLVWQGSTPCYLRYLLFKWTFSRRNCCIFQKLVDICNQLIITTMFHAPHPQRVIDHPVLRSTASDGNNGYFKIRLSYPVTAHCIVSDGRGWEHVSVHIVDDKGKKGTERTPTWSEMCKIKDIFWDETDCVVQYHPPKSDYINNHKHTLHLWRPTDQPLPRPDWILVGVK